MQYKYLNPEKTMIAASENNDEYIALIEPGHPMWPAISKRTDIAPYAPPKGLPEAAILERERADMSMSFSQLLIGLVTMGWITEAEGEAWLQRQLPQSIIDLIETLPVEQRFAAKARALQPTSIQRDNTLLGAMAVAKGVTPVQMDTFFRTFSAI